MQQGEADHIAQRFIFNRLSVDDRQLPIVQKIPDGRASQLLDRPTRILSLPGGKTGSDDLWCPLPSLESEHPDDFRKLSVFHSWNDNGLSGNAIH